MATPDEVIEIIGEDDYKLIFGRGEKEKYSDDEKLRLGQLVLKYKKEYEQSKRDKKKQGYIARACREFYSDLKFAKHDDPLLDKATKMAGRALKRVLDDPALLEITTSKKKFRAAGGGRKPTFSEVRVQAFEWYFNVRYYNTLFFYKNNFIRTASLRC